MKEKNKNGKRKKGRHFCSEYTRISKQDFDANVGVQYSVLMGFKKKKTYTAIEEKRIMKKRIIIQKNTRKKILIMMQTI